MNSALRPFPIRELRTPADGSAPSLVVVVEHGAQARAPWVETLRGELFAEVKDPQSTPRIEVLDLATLEAIDRMLAAGLIVAAPQPERCSRIGRSGWIFFRNAFVVRSLRIGLWIRASLTPWPAKESAAPPLPSQLHRSGSGATVSAGGCSGDTAIATAIDRGGVEAVGGIQLGRLLVFDLMEDPRCGRGVGG